MSEVKSDVGRFGMVPQWVLVAAANPRAIHLYAVLSCFYADHETGESFPSRRTIASVMGVTDRTVDAAIDELERIGALETEERRTPRGDLTSSRYLLKYAAPGVAKVPSPPTEESFAAKEEGTQSQLPSTSPPSGSRGKRTYKPITESFKLELASEFALALGGGEAVMESIARALNHTASRSWIDKRRGLRDWLKRDVKYREGREEGHANGRAQGHPQPGRRSSVGRAGRPAGEGGGW